MERPRVLMSVGASVDGKVTLTRQQTLMQQPSGRLWAEAAPARADELQPDIFELARQQYGCTATLEGSGSLVPEGSEPTPLPQCRIDPAELYTDFLPAEILARPSPRACGVLVLVCRSTPADYLGYLRAEAFAIWWPVMTGLIWRRP